VWGGGERCRKRRKESVGMTAVTKTAVLHGEMFVMVVQKKGLQGATPAFTTTGYRLSQND
jgi:hypothetical protein